MSPAGSGRNNCGLRGPFPDLGGAILRFARGECRLAAVPPCVGLVEQLRGLGLAAGQEVAVAVDRRHEADIFPVDRTHGEPSTSLA